MKVDCAPMEGITDSVWRRMHHRFYGGIDRYYLPFISPTRDHLFTAKEMRGLSPDNNRGFTAVPQFLTRNAEDFLWAAGGARDLGYNEVNLNLGCPSGTVVAKRKGAGMLADPGELDRFLTDVFEKAPLPVSVKTRIGIASPDEFNRLLEVFRNYPIRELIIHPRTQKELYRGGVHTDAYERAAAVCSFPVTFNGNLQSVRDVSAFAETHPEAERVMIGRGLAADPMLGMRVAGIAPDESGCRSTLRAFHDALCEGYIEVFGTPHSSMSRMKDVWHYFISLFDDADGKYRKRIGKSRDYGEFRMATDAVFDDLPMLSAPRELP